MGISKIIFKYLHYFKRITKLSAFKEASFYGFSNIINQLMAFVSVIFVSRYLGPASLGLMAFVQNYAGIFMSLLGGADYYFSWTIGKKEHKISFIKEYMTHRFYVAIFVLLIALMLALYTMPRDVFYYVLIIMLPIIFTSLSPLYLYSIYEKKARVIFIIQTVSMLFLFISKLMLVYFKAPLIYFIIISGIDMGINSILYFVYYFWTYKVWRKDLIKFKFFNPINTLKFYFDIRYAVIAPALWILLLRADQMLIGFLSSKFPILNLGQGGAYNLGVYSAAVKLAEIPNMLAVIIYVVLISRLGKIVERGESAKLRKVFIFYVLSGIFMSVMVVIFAPLMISIVYGDKFLDSVNILRIYGLSIVFVYIITFYTALLGAEDKHKYQACIFLIGVIVNILCIIFLTYFWGLIGTAFATVIAYSLIAFMLYFKNR